MKAAAAIAALMLVGCAAAPTWYDEPHAVVPIRWIRIQEAPQSEVRDGACVLYMPDTSSRHQVDRIAAEPLVQQCIARGGLRPGAGDFDLHWYLVDGTLEAARRYTEISPRAGTPSPRALLAPKGGGNDIADGFTVLEGPACRVVTHGTHRLGHELRHCYEGNWHP